MVGAGSGWPVVAPAIVELFLVIRRYYFLPNNLHNAVVLAWTLGRHYDLESPSRRLVFPMPLFGVATVRGFSCRWIVAPRLVVRDAVVPGAWRVLVVVDDDSVWPATLVPFVGPTRTILGVVFVIENSVHGAWVFDNDVPFAQ